MRRMTVAGWSLAAVAIGAVLLLTPAGCSEGDSGSERFTQCSGRQRLWQAIRDESCGAGAGGEGGAAPLPDSCPQVHEIDHCATAAVGWHGDIMASAPNHAPGTDDCCYESAVLSE